MRRIILSMLVAAFLAPWLASQDGDHNPGTPSPGQSDQRMENMPGMNMGGMDPSDLVLGHVHAGSGTAWGAASEPGHEWMLSTDGWDVMVHGVVFATYNQQGGPRGAGKAESVNWAMFMEQHRLGKGTILFRQMFSAESLTSPHPGFPELFQTGETYHNMPLVDHQHPHNVFAELSLYYLRPIGGKVSWMFYGGPSAEPALGPVVFIHRASASELPAAPLGHHLQDSTHTSFGVVTTGLVVDRIQVEASAFNGREPNEQRWSIQLAPLDSWSGRFSIAPSRNWTAQYSYGRLQHPEALEPGSERRQTASVEYDHPLAGGNWATSVVWGRKHKELDQTTQNSYLLESTVNFWRRNYGYTRLELVDKDELFPQNPLHPSYRIGAYTFGGVRDLVQNRAWQLGLGGDVTFYSKPEALDEYYGVHPVSFRVFLRVRPGLSRHGHDQAP